MHKKYLHINRKAWDLRTQIHFASSFYDVSAFKRGAISLKPPELELVGDPKGKSLLHLQCHFGLDTLSWARIGAKATGIDFSSVSIRTAKQLAEEVAIPARFLYGDVSRLDEVLGTERFDLIVATYGIICWISDIVSWALGIHKHLVDGGRFILVEFHPILEVFYPGKVSGANSYFAVGGRPVYSKSRGTYADPSAPISYTEYRWQHSVGDVVSALIKADLKLQYLHEYPFCSYKIADDLKVKKDGLWHFGRNKKRLPLMYGIVAGAAH